MSDLSHDPKDPAYRLDLRYIGTGFHGWQSQPSGLGIQDHVEKALGILLRHPVRIVGASRTDSGVHAEHQVATFKTPVDYTPVRWLKSLNGLLPESIGVMGVEPVSPQFHPIYSAKGKAYRYRLWQGSGRHPMVQPFAWTLHRDLDLEAISRALPDFVGIHDFTSFCALDSSARTKSRHVLAVHLEIRGPLVDLWFVGKGFLKQMIRIMVGTLVDIGLGKLPPDAIPSILNLRRRDAASLTAPANGLSLVKIFYDEIPSIEVILAEIKSGYSIGI